MVMCIKVNCINVKYNVIVFVYNSTLELKYKMIYIHVQVLKNVKSNDVIYCVSHISCSDVYDTIYGLLSMNNVCTCSIFSRSMLYCYLMHDPFLVFELPVAIVKCKLQLQRYYIHKQELSFIMTTHFMIPVVHDNILGINQYSGKLITTKL